MSLLPPFWRNFLIGTVISIVLGVALIFLDSQNLLSLEFEFIGAKAIIAAQGPDPRLSAIGYAFPPFLIYLTMLLGSPISTQILFGTGLVGFFIWLVGQLQASWFWRSAILVLLLINPGFLIMLLTSPTWTAASLFLGLAALLYWHLINPRDHKYPLSVNLVLLGLTLAPLVLLRYEFWLLLPVLLILSWFCVRENHIPLKSTQVLVTGFMSLISIAGFLYVNLLIGDDPFYFFYASGNGLRWSGLEFLLESAPGLQAIGTSFSWLGQTLPVYYLICILSLLKVRGFLVARILLLSLPVLILILIFWQNNFLPQIAIFGAFSVLIPVTLIQFSRIESLLLSLIAFGLILSAYLTGNLLNTNRFIPDESLVWRQITGQGIPQTGIVSRWRQKQLDQREISDLLFQRLRPGQKVLLDDAVNFSFIYLLQNSHIFILPHQYEFSVALNQPEELVDYILVRRETGQPLPETIPNVILNDEEINTTSTDYPRKRRRVRHSLGSNNLFSGFVNIRSNTFYQLFQRQ
ncbi:hypothetical protein [Gloeomargarita sp.]